MNKFFFLGLFVLTIKADIDVNDNPCEQCGAIVASEDPTFTGVVCGEDGRTYLSECFATCNGVDVLREGRCARHNCPQLYYPVCTASGRTYVNECEANFYAERVVRPGFCQSVERFESNLRQNNGPYLYVQLIPGSVNNRDYQWP